MHMRLVCATQESVSVDLKITDVDFHRRAWRKLKFFILQSVALSETQGIGDLCIFVHFLLVVILIVFVLALVLDETNLDFA